MKFDNRDTYRPGAKFAEYELKGVPVRIAIGNRDLENNTVEVARRDTLAKETVHKMTLLSFIENLLEEIQDHLFTKAIDFRTAHTTHVSTLKNLRKPLKIKGVLYLHIGMEPLKQKIK